MNIPSATLPECPHRADSSSPVLYLCSHSHVRAADGLVTAEICQLCSVRELPSESVQRTGRPDRPPRLLRQAWNITQAMAAFVADGCRTLDEDAYRQRLEVCEGCGQYPSVSMAGWLPQISNSFICTTVGMQIAVMTFAAAG